VFKKALIQILKVALTAGLIYWLISSGKISLQPFYKLQEQSWLIPFSLLSTLLVILINNYRWLILMRCQGVFSTHFQTLKLSFIGLFF
jgi:hypothetical protein